MDGDASLRVPPRDLVRPLLNSDTTSSSSSSSSSSSFFYSSSSPPELLRHVQAALKRHRPLGTMPTYSIRPRRMVVPQPEASRNEASNVSSNVGTKISHDVVLLSQDNGLKDSILHAKNPIAAVRETAFREAHQDDASITPPFPGTITKTFDESSNPFDAQMDECKSGVDCVENNPMPLLNVESQHVDGKRKVQFLTAKNSTFQEMDWNAGSQIDAPNVINDGPKHDNLQNVETEISAKADSAVSLLTKRTAAVEDQLHQLRNFLSQPATQSSVVRPSCPTTTSVHSSSAPMINSTTHCSRSNLESGAHVATEPLGDLSVNAQHINQGNNDHMICPSKKVTGGTLIDQTAVAAQASTSAIDAQSKDHHQPREQQGSMPKESDLPKDASRGADNPNNERGSSYDVTDVQSQASLTNNPSTGVKLEPSKPEKQEKAATGKGASAPRKRSYDPDYFFKVNGKLYQRLGKIGSGGSSEVHKVISSDCTIYALKKIKLKGRDYATAYGFCQEIEYLNRLKGKNNIIQLIDYEVTEKTLLREVMNGSMNNKDGRVKDDGYIYMVLEYGEIDLASMLSQKWKEIDGSNLTMDENWLRFYWQQILLAVNTIHEERIVHSDLKPANFLLVKGSLKLIDFGIAKAIMSDTTNIQRDSQVGTLSYMSPEAFMCNESDANGNVIKCGRPSDIWSLGCILYQMVYGRTPFSEYKTFWAKFKVITDPHHEITYEPVSNPWLLDLMKKCLAWERNERWRIPELLKHPFLVPPAQPQPSLPREQGSNLLQFLAETCAGDQKGSMLFSELQDLFKAPITHFQAQSLTSRDQQCQLLSQISKLCFQLQEHLAKS